MKPLTYIYGSGVFFELSEISKIEAKLLDEICREDHIYD